MDYRIQVLENRGVCRYCGEVVYGPNEFGAWVSEDSDGQPLAWCEARQNVHLPRRKSIIRTVFHKIILPVLDTGTKQV